MSNHGTSYEISTKYKAQSFNYRVRFLVLHYTACDFKRSLELLTGNQVSSHYLVPASTCDEEKTVYQLVPEELRAWTQGVSHWRGRNNLNDQGVSIEMVNLGHTSDNGITTWDPYPQRQIDIVIGLSKDIVKRYDIDPSDVIAHSDCSPGRKEDPGPHFPWKQLYENGVGAWPDLSDVNDFSEQMGEDIDLKEFQQDLGKYGYDINIDGVNTVKTKQCISSFQMHFRNNNFDGEIDKETASILKALLKKYRN